MPSNPLADALIASARRIGADPLDYATVMSYETGGRMDPSIRGGAGNRHIGLIQFGPAEAKQYGASQDQSFEQQLPAVEAYLTDRGFKPGMNRLDLYSTINAGRPGLYNASDAGNGGAPGTVADKVAGQMGAHEAKAAAFLGGDFTPRVPDAAAAPASFGLSGPTQGADAGTVLPAAGAAMTAPTASKPDDSFDAAKVFQSIFGQQSAAQAGQQPAQQQSAPALQPVQRRAPAFDPSAFYALLQRRPR